VTSRVLAVEEVVEHFIGHLNTEVAIRVCWSATGSPMYRYLPDPHPGKFTRIARVPLTPEGSFAEHGGTIYCFVENSTGYVFRPRDRKHPNKDMGVQYRLADPSSRNRLYLLALQGREFYHRGLIPDRH